MITWTIEQSQKEGRRQDVTVNLEGKVTSRDCAGIFTLCFDNFSRCDQLVLDLAQVEEPAGSIPILICCLSRTAGFAEGRISLRGIPSPWQPGPTADFTDSSQGAACVNHKDCPCCISRLASVGVQ